MDTPSMLVIILLVSCKLVLSTLVSSSVFIRVSYFPSILLSSTLSFVVLSLSSFSSRSFLSTRICSRLSSCSTTITFSILSATGNRLIFSFTLFAFMFKSVST
uniref:NADH dehydrogenase subunit 4L n=1 Tax=Cacopsylla melanoneura TaxID=428564 RepID=A0A8D8MA96_9HEMI